MKEVIEQPLWAEYIISQTILEELLLLLWQLPLYTDRSFLSNYDFMINLYITEGLAGSSHFLIYH